MAQIELFTGDSAFRNSSINEEISPKSIFFGVKNTVVDCEYKWVQNSKLGLTNVKLHNFANCLNFTL